MGGGKGYGHRSAHFGASVQSFDYRIDILMDPLGPCYLPSTNDTTSGGGRGVGGQYLERHPQSS